MNKIEEVIIDKYIKVINEFFDSINDYLNINLIDNHNKFLSGGLSIIKNIFEYTLTKKKNLVTVELYSQRAFFYYLEYIKQLQEVEMYLDIDYTQTCVFVYEKIVSEINNDDVNTISNILSLTDINEKIQDLDIKDIISNINVFISNLFNWNTVSKIDDYKKIYKNNISIIKKYYKNMYLINKYINLLKEKLEISQDDNVKIINDTCSIITNTNKKIEEDYNFIRKFYINEETLKDKYKSLNTREFVYWLISQNNR
jgi:predicted transcriptional regulator